MKAFYEKYLTLNLKDYGISLDLEINKVLIVIFLGLCAACFFVNYSQSNIALVLRKLLRSGAVGEDNAKTLAELGLSSAKPVKKLLSKSGGPMKSIISYVGEVKLTYEEYIAREKAERAAKKAQKRGDVKRPSRDAVRGEINAPIQDSKEESDNKNISSAALNDEREELSITEIDTPDTSADIEKFTENQCFEENKASKNDIETIDFSTAKFFIREEKKEAAMRAFSKNSGSLIKTALSCVLLLGFCLALVFLMPTILSAVKGIIFK